MMGITWGEFKKLVEEKEITDEIQIDFINVLQGSEKQHIQVYLTEEKKVVIDEYY